jgi:hypothetical protein
MKKLITIALVAATITGAQAQKINAAKVPAAVKAAFTKQYPGIAAKWEKEDGKYEAGFTQNGHIMSATYEPNGPLTETETDIAITELPEAAAAYVKTNYKGKKIKAAAKITRADGSINYEAEVNGRDVIFDAGGKFLKEVKG